MNFDKTMKVMLNSGRFQLCLQCSSKSPIKDDSTVLGTGCQHTESRDSAGIANGDPEELRVALSSAEFCN